MKKPYLLDAFKFLNENDSYDESDLRKFYDDLVWKMVLEESFVIALERCIIRLLKEDRPDVPAYSPDEAFKYALVRVATNLTSGPFRDFASKYFFDIYNNFRENHRDYYKIHLIYD